MYASGRTKLGSLTFVTFLRVSEFTASPPIEPARHPISFPEHARSRVSGGQGSGETEFSRTILYGSRMLFNDSHQIVIHIYCGPTKHVS